MRGLPTRRRVRINPESALGARIAGAAPVFTPNPDTAEPLLIAATDPQRIAYVIYTSGSKGTP